MHFPYKACIDISIFRRTIRIKILLPVSLALPFDMQFLLKVISTLAFFSSYVCSVLKKIFLNEAWYIESAPGC